MTGNKSSVSTSKNTTIRYIQSNKFEPHNIQVWVNPINCKGVMGAGLAAFYRDEFPAMHEDYKQRCKREEILIGQPYLYKKSTPWILNFPTKQHWRDRSKLTDIEKGLQYFVEHAKEWGIQSIAFPALGCGLGKLSWSKVYPLMRKYLQQLEGVRVEIFSKDPEPLVEKTKPISDFFKSKLTKKRPLTTQEKPNAVSKKIKITDATVKEASSETSTL